MKILIITPVFYPELGGGEKYLFHLVNKLAEENSVAVITSGKSIKGIRKINNITIYYCKYANIFGTEIVSPHVIFKLMRDTKPDIIHGSAPSLMQDIGFLIAKVLRIPMVATYHADLQLNRVISRLYTKVSTWLVLRNMHRIIVTSPKYFHILKNRGINENKISIVPVGVEFDKFNRIRKDSGQALADERVILFVGRLDARHRYKRLDLLMSAFVSVKKKINNVRLIIIGQGDLVQDYENIACNLGIQSNVVFYTDVNDDELPHYYARADVFVLPSPTEEEGFGIVLLEAMSAGIPVITSNRCGGAYAIEKGKSGLLYKAFDVADLSDKIMAILSDKSLADTLGINGSKFARQFDWSYISDDIKKIYNTCR